MLTKTRMVVLISSVLLMVYVLGYLSLRYYYQYDGGLSKDGNVVIQGSWSVVVQYTGIDDSRSILRDLFIPVVYLDYCLLDRRTLLIDDHGLVTWSIDGGAQEGN